MSIKLDPSSLLVSMPLVDPWLTLLYNNMCNHLNYYQLIADGAGCMDRATIISLACMHFNLQQIAMEKTKLISFWEHPWTVMETVLW